MTTHRSAIRSVIGMLSLLVVMSLGFSAVSIAYAMGRHSHASTMTGGWAVPADAPSPDHVIPTH